MGLLRHYNRWHKGEKRQEDQHEYVDLGLPSGLLWAKCNMDADNEFETGGYYSWGETEEKGRYNWENYKFTKNSKELSKYTKEDGLTILKPEDDVVHVKWGGKWRMPTKDEIDELIKYTSYDYVKDYNESGVNGMLFRSLKTDNKSTLFIPFGGFMEDDYKYDVYTHAYIWSSVSDESLDSNAYFMMLYKEDYVHNRLDSKFYGHNIRGVREK